jgi:putative toxin-antitoxin system antitoxin component (TIGR02293 family)
LPSYVWHNVGVSLLQEQIAEWLGVPPIRSDGEILQIVEQQLPTSSIKRLLALGLSRQEIDALVIPLRTLQHRRSKREKLTVEESDRVLRVVRLLSQAETVYGSRERALAWLRRPVVRLQNRAPLDLLRTDTGARVVEELLVQIDDGIFV